MKRLCTAVGLGLWLGLAAGTAQAQGFGKNKVQYDDLEWAVLESPHLRVHFYAEEESLARRITPFAESVAVEYDRRFRNRPKNHIPILLYSAHYLFQQTNAADGFISEGTGGLTELIKGRVLIPHNGSWARLAWVTRHELTHAYMMDKIGVVMREHHRNQSYLPPLWFTEGLAEYCGTHWDEDAEGLLRDAILTREARPLTNSDDITGTVLMYKEGQSFLLWLADRYGSEKVFDLFDNWASAEDFETVFRLTFGSSLVDLDTQWFTDMKRRYYPQIVHSAEPAEVARRLTRRGEYNLGPRTLPGSSSDSLLRFCYFQADESGIDLILSQPRRDGTRQWLRLIHSGRTPAFESFHLFLNRPSVSRDGLIALTAKRGGRDALTLFDPKHGRILRQEGFDNLVVLHDPAWAPGDSALIFSAQDYSGRSDLYRVSWPGGQTQLERLTNDDYDDLEPDISPDGRWVVFASDRGGRGGRYSLFRLSLAGGVPEPVSFPDRGEDRQPVYSPDGKWIAFRSTRGGISDLWVRHAEPDSAARRVISLWGPASDPDWLPNGSGLVFTAQHAIRFQTFSVRFKPDTLEVEREPGETPRPMPCPDRFADLTKPYERRLGLDLIQNAVSFDPALGSAGAGQIAFSDVLGNERVLFALSNDSERFGNFWDGWEGGATYLNQARRLNFGASVFRLTEVYDADLDIIRREKRVGVAGIAIYPFSKFTRVEATLVVRHVTDHLLRSGEIQTVDLVSNFFTWAHDDTRWTGYGPVQGMRMYLTAGYTRDLSAGDADFATLLGELRQYVQPIRNVVFANRVLGQSSMGPDAQRFYLGWDTIRGYDRRALSGLQTLTVQNDLRFPILRGFTLAVPAPWELPTVSGGAFADASWGWDEGFQQQLGSAGFSFWVGGGFFPALRWNYAWLTHDLRFFTQRPRTQFLIDFNF